jgi:hypothetical protein
MPPRKIGWILGRFPVSLRRIRWHSLRMAAWWTVEAAALSRLSCGRFARIEFQFCQNEAAALKHESKLIRTIKPKFNRAAVWPGKTRFIVWRLAQNQLELAITEVPESTWRRFGGTVGVSRYLHESLCRLLWLALNPARAHAELPAGWTRGVFGQATLIHCGKFSDKIESLLELNFWKSSDEFLLWLTLQISARAHSFERTAIEVDLEVLKEFATKLNQKPDFVPQLGLL